MSATEAPPITRDGTLAVARAVHQVIDARCENPFRLQMRRVFSFLPEGYYRVHFDARHAPGGAVVISEPGNYNRIWGPHLATLAAYLWRELAHDLQHVGVSVQSPTDEQMTEMYYGPMPLTDEAAYAACDGWNLPGRAGWCLPGRAVQASEARERFVQELEARTEPFTPLAPGTPRHAPYQEFLAQRMAAVSAPNTLAAKSTPQVTEQPEAQTWEFGHWGKGALSASGKLYTWKTSSPADGGYPQHSHANELIAAIEGHAVLEAARERTEHDEIGYLCPIVIAPNGLYTQLSAHPFWKLSDHMPEQARALLTASDPSVFEREVKALRQALSAAHWEEQSLSSGGYGHAGRIA